ncbi:acetylserotonin O-methyltransferase [Streptomyces sp. SCA3-4]|uniref:acetylserotonin O-methyltransferase n=1 Tax=Streptomyces sichuanensis TaxID=2871810 RepID=UPI001CE37A74|nr:acetylserotonin O-methyltransferase [Streptomyces sichuanensis]MCA6091935.1 acetylserotonin O-methyltransferase [Streptomyces sichuanensis]
MTTNPAPPAGPAGIMAIATAFSRARALHAAVELDLFTVLDAGGLTAQELHARCGLHPRGAADFLDLLTVLGLLERDGDRYRNGPAATEYLVRSRPRYLGDLVRLQSEDLYPRWLHLAEALRDGRPRSGGPGQDEIFGEEYHSERARWFHDAMDGASSSVLRELPRLLPWQDVKHVVDLGGARGTVAAGLVRAHPHLTATVFDLPQLEPLFDEHMRRLGTAAGAAFRAGDFFRDPLPACDCVVIGHVLHNWGAAERVLLLARAYEALRPGGYLLVYDPMIDDGRTTAPQLVLSLNMLMMTPTGSEYTRSACREWAVEAGFEDIAMSVVPASGDTVLTARKPPAV